MPNLGPSGFLPVAKPAGMTSFDVIRELRRLLHVRKLGHSGVLDRPATGVLVVALNKATRLFELFSQFDKEYIGEIWLGLSTTTDDLTVSCGGLQPFTAPTQAEVAEALATYRGSFDQLPPAFSLTKKGGRELYRYALAGQAVEVEPKNVTITGCEILQFETAIDPARWWRRAPSCSPRWRSCHHSPACGCASAAAAGSMCAAWRAMWGRTSASAVRWGISAVPASVPSRWQTASRWSSSPPPSATVPR